MQASSSPQLPIEQRTLYQVHIVQTTSLKDTIHVVAYIPEDFQFSQHIDWGAPFADGLNAGELSTVLTAAGIRPVTQSMTTQMWRGSSEIEITLPLIFIAETDERTEVLQNIVDLMRLAMPTTVNGGVNGLFKAPGPTYDPAAIEQYVVDTGAAVANLFKYAYNRVTGNPQTTNGSGTPPKALPTYSVSSLMKNKIGLSIGQFLYLDNVVITNIDQMYKAILAPSGIPLEATVNVSFRTVLTPTTNDILRAFNVAPPTAQYSAKA